jgi:hypothetical protein
MEALLDSVPAETVEVAVEEAVKKAPKKKRAPSSYNLFVSEHIRSPEALKLPPRERMKFVAEAWKREKARKV